MRHDEINSQQHEAIKTAVRTIVSNPNLTIELNYWFSVYRRFHNMQSFGSVITNGFMLLLGLPIHILMLGATMATSLNIAIKVYKIDTSLPARKVLTRLKSGTKTALKEIVQNTDLQKDIVDILAEHQFTNLNNITFLLPLINSHIAAIENFTLTMPLEEADIANLLSLSNPTNTEILADIAKVAIDISAGNSFNVPLDTIKRLGEFCTHNQGQNIDTLSIIAAKMLVNFGMIAPENFDRTCDDLKIIMAMSQVFENITLPEGQESFTTKEQLAISLISSISSHSKEENTLQYKESIVSFTSIILTTLLQKENEQYNNSPAGEYKAPKNSIIAKIPSDLIRRKLLETPFDLEGTATILQQILNIALGLINNNFWSVIKIFIEEPETKQSDIELSLEIAQSNLQNQELELQNILQQQTNLELSYLSYNELITQRNKIEKQEASDTTTTEQELHNIKTQIQIIEDQEKALKNIEHKKNEANKVIAEHKKEISHLQYAIEHFEEFALIDKIVEAIPFINNLITEGLHPDQISPLLYDIFNAQFQDEQAKLEQYNALFLEYCIDPTREEPKEPTTPLHNLFVSNNDINQDIIHHLVKNVMSIFPIVGTILNNDEQDKDAVTQILRTLFTVDAKKLPEQNYRIHFMIDIFSALDESNDLKKIIQELTPSIISIFSVFQHTKVADTLKNEHFTPNTLLDILQQTLNLINAIPNSIGDFIPIWKAYLKEVPNESTKNTDISARIVNSLPHIGELLQNIENLDNNSIYQEFTALLHSVLEVKISIDHQAATNHEKIPTPSIGKHFSQTPSIDSIQEIVHTLKEFCLAFCNNKFDNHSQIILRTILRAQKVLSMSAGPLREQKVQFIINDLEQYFEGSIPLYLSPHIEAIERNDENATMHFFLLSFGLLQNAPEEIQNAWNTSVPLLQTILNFINKETLVIENFLEKYLGEKKIDDPIIKILSKLLTNPETMYKVLDALSKNDKHNIHFDILIATLEHLKQQEQHTEQDASLAKLISSALEKNEVFTNAQDVKEILNNLLEKGNLQNIISLLQICKKHKGGNMTSLIMEINSHGLTSFIISHTVNMTYKQAKSKTLSLAAGAVHTFTSSIASPLMTIAASSENTQEPLIIDEQDFSYQMYPENAPPNADFTKASNTEMLDMRSAHLQINRPQFTEDQLTALFGLTQENIQYITIVKEDMPPLDHEEYLHDNRSFVINNIILQALQQTTALSQKDMPNYAKYITNIILSNNKLHDYIYDLIMKNGPKMVEPPPKYKHQVTALPQQYLSVALLQLQPFIQENKKIFELYDTINETNLEQFNKNLSEELFARLLNTELAFAAHKETDDIKEDIIETSKTMFKALKSSIEDLYIYISNNNISTSLATSMLSPNDTSMVSKYMLKSGVLETAKLAIQTKVFNSINNTQKQLFDDVTNIVTEVKKSLENTALNEGKEVVMSDNSAQMLLLFILKRLQDYGCTNLSEEQSESLKSKITDSTIYFYKDLTFNRTMADSLNKQIHDVIFADTERKPYDMMNNIMKDAIAVLHPDIPQDIIQNVAETVTKKLLYKKPYIIGNYMYITEQNIRDLLQETTLISRPSYWTTFIINDTLEMNSNKLSDFTAKLSNKIQEQEKIAKNNNLEYLIDLLQRNIYTCIEKEEDQAIFINLFYKLALDNKTLLLYAQYLKWNDIISTIDNDIEKSCAQLAEKITDLGEKAEEYYNIMQPRLKATIATALSNIDPTLNTETNVSLLFKNLTENHSIISHYDALSPERINELLLSTGVIKNTARAYNWSNNYIVNSDKLGNFAMEVEHTIMNNPNITR